MVKNRGFGGKRGFSWVLWLKIGVLLKNRGFFRKMGFSWVFGQEFGENKERAGNLIIS